jgi:hypothetical protein
MLRNGETVHYFQARQNTHGERTLRGDKRQTPNTIGVATGSATGASVCRLPGSAYAEITGGTTLIAAEGCAL